MFQVATEEADKSIQEAYTKGFHEAELKYSPQVAYWKKRAEGAESAESGLRTYAFNLGIQRDNATWNGLGIGTAAGVGLTLLIEWISAQVRAH